MRETQPIMIGLFYLFSGRVIIASFLIALSKLLYDYTRKWVENEE